MRRLLVLIAMLGAMGAAMLGPGSASAFAPTCGVSGGGNVTHLTIENHQWPPTVWNVSFTPTCGAGKLFNWWIQWSTTKDGTYTNASATHDYTCDGNCDGFHYKTDFDGVLPCSGTHWYRLHAQWATGANSGPVGWWGGVGC